MIIGTAGHIDHGKTSLVRRLTGVDTDRLKEEKARGISIDLGFAYLSRASGEVFGFVDVPGHERFVHNMLAGATGIDFVMLVIAADDGVMPQTREHLAIIDLLGLDRGLVALNKCDLASSERTAEVSREIALALEGTALASAAIVPVSAATGHGLDHLLAKLDAAAATGRRKSSDGLFRLAVDRCFTLPGRGTTVTGTVLSGSVRINDAVIVSPSGIEARVRSIHAQDRPAESGEAGQRCALVLAGAKATKEAIHRGEVVLAPELHAQTQRIDVRLRVLPSEPRPVGQWTPVKVHHAASETPGRIVVLRDTPIAPSETEYAQLVLDRPIAAIAGDRLILRDTTSSRTLGGGTIVDLHPPERRRRTSERRAALEAMAIPDLDGALAAVLAASPGWIDLAAFLRDRGRSPTESEAVVTRLDLAAIWLSGGPVALLRHTWNSFAAGIGSALDAFHDANPDLPGLAAERIRLQATPRLPVPTFAVAMQLLAAKGEVRIDRAWLRRPGHEVRLGPEEERMWARIMPRLGGAERFRPPRVRDVARAMNIEETAVRRVARFAARRGDVEEIAHDHYFLYPTVVEMADIARALASAEPKGFTVIQFRDRLDNGRKVAIQILEFFDRHGLTIRRGDLRRINVHRAALFFPPAMSNDPGTRIGGVPFPVGRPDFKSGWGCQTVPGGFDSHPPPPSPRNQTRS